VLLQIAKPVSLPRCNKGLVPQKALVGRRLPRSINKSMHTKVPEGFLAGISALAIPGVGPLIAAGLIVASLTGGQRSGAWSARLLAWVFLNRRQNAVAEHCS
jgi:hypothetical protein